VRRKQDTYTLKNKVQLVQGGQEYFALLEQLVNKAQHTVYILVYIFDDDHTGTQIADALKRAAQRGVKVYLLVDGYGARVTKHFILGLKEAGVKFRRFNPLFSSKHFYIGRRMHIKLVVVDAVYALVGGRNIADYYNDLPGRPAWLDLALYIEGEAAPALERVCIRGWNSMLEPAGRAKPTPMAAAGRSIAALDIQQTCRVAVRRNDWVRAKTEILSSYYTMFRTAKEEIVILGSYFLPGYKMRRYMEKAAERGVRIKVVVTGVSDVLMAKYAERYLYKWMLRKNIEVYEYTRNVLHAKAAVADHSRMTIGSFNVNNLSAHVSIELNVDVDDKPFVSEVQQQFNHIIAGDCMQITDEWYSKSSIFRRLMERLAYEALRLMLYVTTFYYKSEKPAGEAAEYNY
jgi:cardiolipin synthase